MTLSPVTRLSVGLVLLTVSALLFGQLLGVVPDSRSAELESRKVIAESLAVQVSSAITSNDPMSVVKTLRAVVSRNNSVDSVGVRLQDGELLAQAGNHEQVWRASNSQKSTATHVIVPLFKDEARWGSIEVRFSRFGGKGRFAGTFLSLILFLAGFGLIAYHVFLRRALRELNPDAVIPERVRTALNTLAEGVLIIDAKEQIVFANRVFISKTELSAEELIGKPVHELNWEVHDQVELPWITLLRGDTPPGPVKVSLVTPLGSRFHLVVNASPISGGPNQPLRGVMTTFDDTTELEKANDELRHALQRLESNEKEIKRQNRELQELATRDSLTGCLNRRSLFKSFETLIEEATTEGTTLSCIMVDIDHFKSVNDNFGHAAGDAVIKRMAEILRDHASPDDLIGRYGGEEFCIVLPDRDGSEAAELAQSILHDLRAGKCTTLSKMPLVTASFGVCELSDDAANQSVLIDCADEALYVAKENGRNQVRIYGEQVTENEDTETPEAIGESAPVSRQPEVDYVSTLEMKIEGLESALTLKSGDGVLERVTELPERQLFLDRTDQAIKRAKRYRHNVVVMSINLEALPRVRDALGDMAAEKFRQIAVNLIRATLRCHDTIGLMDSNELPHSVARIDAEQVGMLLTDIKNVELVPRIVQRVQDVLAAPQEIAGNEVSLSADVGISIYPQDSLDAVTLLRHAKAAMSAAIRSPGRDRTRYYAPEINAMSKRRLQLETDLRRAVEREEFTLHYQPKVSLRKGNIVGMEALLRWNHRQRGQISPDEFIPVAEQIGCMAAISQKTIRSVCKQIKAWDEAGLGEISIAVNLSAIEFQDPGLADKILSTVNEVGIDPSLLEFEITESVVMDDADGAAQIMRTLTSAGARISIDDFGTQYATLQCLTHFPISTIKIDRSFMHNILTNAQDAAVVNGVTTLAHTMGLTVVAEGVEHAEQIAYLRDLQCDQIQGYYLSRPVSSDQARELLANPVRIQSLIIDARDQDNQTASGAQFLGLINEMDSAGVN